IIRWKTSGSISRASWKSSPWARSRRRALESGRRCSLTTLRAWNFCWPTPCRKGCPIWRCRWWYLRPCSSRTGSWVCFPSAPSHWACWLLHDVSFTLEKNRMLALVGPYGGGKSTVANLLSRFWDVKQGQILVRGRDIRDIPLSDLMDQISMVFQRVYLFQDTVYNNIAMGRTDATREEVYEAARKARCYDFIM